MNSEQCSQSGLTLWKQQGFGVKHTQSRRFLDPEYDGTAEDPSLRPLVELLASGTPVTDDRMIPMRPWLARFSCIRLAERSVEGIHSIVTKASKRAPRASMSYYSMELRFPSLWKQFADNPQVSNLDN